jgi:FtsZ-interacting cell division protein ZipA
MSRKTWLTLLLIIVSALLAIALFIAGAIWRGRVTARSAFTDSRKLPVTAKLAASGRRQSEEESSDVPGGTAYRRTGSTLLL